MIYICIGMLFTCLFIPNKYSERGSYSSYCHDAGSQKLIRETMEAEKALQIVKSMDAAESIKCYTEGGESV